MAKIEIENKKKGKLLKYQKGDSLIAKIDEAINFQNKIKVIFNYTDQKYKEII
jgi:hypothetical protein